MKLDTMTFNEVLMHQSDAIMQFFNAGDPKVYSAVLALEAYLYGYADAKERKTLDDIKNECSTKISELKKDNPPDHEIDERIATILIEYARALFRCLSMLMKDNGMMKRVEATEEDNISHDEYDPDD